MSGVYTLTCADCGRVSLVHYDSRAEGKSIQTRVLTSAGFRAQKGNTLMDALANVQEAEGWTVRECRDVAIDICASCNEKLTAAVVKAANSDLTAVKSP